jgi:hypothetical protein
MTTIILKDNSSSAQQFLAFARTLPYVNIIETSKAPAKKFKKSVADILKKSEQGIDLVACRDAEDMFNQLGI